MEGGGKSMENYLPNFSRASNGRMATFHLSFLISPLNVRSFVRSNVKFCVESLNRMGKRSEGEKGRRRRRKIKKKGRK